MTRPFRPFIRLLSALTVLLSPAIASLGSGPFPGEVDLTFNSGWTIDGAASAVVPQNDGKILVATDVGESGIRAPIFLARLNPDGTLDPSFLTGRAEAVATIVVQPDNKILIGGRFPTIHGEVRGGIARLNEDGTLDSTFADGLSGANRTVVGIALQQDGRILIGGDFTTVNGEPRNRIARLHPDGTLDESFGRDLSGADGAVYCLALLGDGKILIGGDFSEINGLPRERVARLNQDGTVDAIFGEGHAGADGSVGALAVQSDGKILIGGRFTNIAGSPRNRIARLHADGGLDDGFGKDLAGADESVGEILLLSDERILISGGFTHLNGDPSAHIARLNRGGTLDESFDASISGRFAWVRSLAVQPDGKLLAGGRFTLVHGEPRKGVARLHPDGGLDEEFHPQSGGLNPWVKTMALQPDGNILIGGSFRKINGERQSNLARLHPDGSLDSTFRAELAGAPFFDAIAVQPDGRIIAGGGYFDAERKQGIVRLHPDGSVDTSFTPPEMDFVHAIAIQPDGKILIGGFLYFYPYGRSGIARLNPDGTWDTTFGEGLKGTGGGSVYSMILQDDGKILLGGRFTMVNGVARSGIARLNSDGSLDETFCEGMEGIGGGNEWEGAAVFSLGVQDDRKVLLGGDFTSVHGVARSGIARLNEDGSLDESFGSGLEGVDNPSLPKSSLRRIRVDGIEVQGDGKVFIGGDFTRVNGVARNRVARLNADGTLDERFGDKLSGADEFIFCMTVDRDGKLLISGDFTSVNGAPLHRMARLHTNAPPPTELRLANHSVAITDPIGAVVGRFTSLHRDYSDRYSFTLVPGEGDEGNRFFAIEENTLKLAAPFEEPVSTYTVRIRATAPDESWLEKIFAIHVEQDLYWTWSRSLPAGERAQADDAGGRGVPNLLRYAFGMDPLQPEKERLPRFDYWEMLYYSPGEPIPSEMHLWLEYLRRTDDAALVYVPEVSDDLLTWHPFEGKESISGDSHGDTEKVYVEALELETGLQRRFFRVRVER